MAATITGIVFNDLNHNGQYDTGEPGIPGVYVTLYSAGGCTTTQTDAAGNYGFSVASAGTYTVYEPVASPNACPPTAFYQPNGFTMSNGPRKLTLSVTAAQVNNGAVIGSQNFSHDTVDNPLVCNTRLIQFVGRPTNWYNINIVTGQSVLQGPVSPAHDVNAIGYNILDNYLYGYDHTTNNIVRIDETGNLIQLLRPTGLPASNYNTGTFDISGFLYLFVNNGTRFYTVDLRPNSATFMKLVDPAAGYTEQTSNYGTALSAATNISDWVYDLVDGDLYGIQRNGVLTRIVPATGQVTSLTTTAPNPDASFGAVAIDSTGTIYAIANNDGTIYKYTFSGNTATGTAFSKTFFDSFNDGTMCPTAAVNVDYGDAPDTGSGNGQGNYNTLLANNGPRHELINALYLGTQVTADPDAHQNATATGDDLTLGIPDDGLTLPLTPVSLSATSYSLPVTVTNQTGVPANLYGWIDFNKNGLFEPDEAAPVVSVPSATGTQTAVLTFAIPAGTLSPGDTFLRLRLTTDSLSGATGIQDGRSVGPASDGEVEDYLITLAAIADLAVVKTADRATLTTGETITYTIAVSNLGPDPATDSVLHDVAPAELTGVLYSTDAGVTWFVWPGSLSLGTLAPGASNTILLRGVYSAAGNGAVANTAEVTTSATDPDLSNNTSTVITPVVPSADLSVTKTADPASVTAGQQLTYTLRVANGGPNTAQNVILTDAVPSAVLNVEYSTDGGVTYQPWSGSLSLGDMAINAVESVLIRGIVDPAASGSIVNTAIVASVTPDPDLSNNTSSVETPVEESADISVVKLGSPKPVQAGQTLSYTVAVANAGPSVAQAVTLTDPVTGELTDVEFSTDNGATFQSWPGSYQVGDMVPGSARTILIRGTVSSSADGDIENTATVSSPTPDPDPTNNSSTDVTPVDLSADLAVTKTGSPSPVPAGGALTYTVTVTNNGPSDAQTVTLSDAIPAEVESTEYSLDGISYQPWAGSVVLGTLAQGASQTVLIRGTVAAAAAGTISNTAVVSSPTPDPDPTNNEDTVIVPVNTSADLAVTKSGAPNPVNRGELLTYTVTVTNNGPDPAVDAVLTDAVPAELTGAEFSVDGGASWQSWTGTYALGTLANAASRQILIRGTVTPAAAGLIENTAVVSSDTPDPNPDNNEATELTAVGEAADLSVVKTSSPSPVQAGDQLTYTVVIANAGPDAAQNVELADLLPSGLLNPEFAVQGGSNFAPWVSPYQVGTLAAGGQFTVTIRATVDPSTAPGVISNTAVVSSSTPDPEPDNNTDSEDTPVEVLADVVVTKVANATPAVPSESFGYTIAVTNAGPSDAQNVILTDAVPAALLVPEFSVDGGGSYFPWSSPYALGTLAAGDSRSILIRGIVSPSATGALLNTAVAASSTPDPDLSNNTATDETLILSVADLSVVKTGSPNPVSAGGQIVYTLALANAGPAEAENVVLSDALPQGLSAAEVSLDGGVSWLPWSGTLSVGSLAAGEARTVLIRAAVGSDVTGTLQNTAVISSDTPDPNPDNNTSTEETAVEASADLAVVKTAQPSLVVPGDELTYTVVLSNAGPADAQNVLLSDELPAALLNAVFSTDGGATWQSWSSPYALGTLTAGESRSILIRATVGSASGSIVNTAVVSGTTPDPDPSNNSSSVETPVGALADLCITKTASPCPVGRGQRLVYTICVANAGPGDAQEVTIADTLPCELCNGALSLDGGACWQPWSGIYTLGTLPANTSVCIRVSGVVSRCACGNIVNTARVLSATPDPNPDNNTACTTTPVRGGCGSSSCC
ncbi:DUF7507 domain-containing protein [Feifania hominis]|uniref:DUF11 domain-containing protein n=1 Tax=Feifania hominis TaxID=2763660 RepID=A0A926DCT3_9FIRM|nr:SdrD B-like domain-containing protein [Feifania hominis]MBC8535831.1 DUF11 domain-containing protein [Feifania hominis]